MTSQGNYRLRNVPTECGDILRSLLASSHKINCIAFPPVGGNSWVITTDRTLFARNIPPECYQKLIEYYAFGQPVVDVAFPPAGGNRWVVVGTQDFFARNIDDECYQMMRNLTQGWRRVTRVAFPNMGGWAVVAQDKFHTRNIDGECAYQMGNFSLRGYQVHNIAFAPINNGWSISSRGAPPALPLDRVRQVEYTVGGSNIWQRMAYYATPGVAIAVVDGNRTAWSTGYGWLEAGSAAASHPESVFQAASVSKAVAACGVMRLLQTRNIKPDDDIQPYLNWTLPRRGCFSDEFGPPKISQVLTHTGGIIGRGSTYPTTACKPFTDKGGGYDGYGPTATVPTLLQVMNGQGTNSPKIELTTPPGMEYHYSGAGFVLLQRMLEQQTGQTLSAYMRSEIFNPLRMYYSTFDLYPTFELASGHTTTGAVIPGKRNRYPEGAAAGLYTNVLDLCSLVAFLNQAWNVPGDTLGPLNKASVTRMLGKGYGWRLENTPTFSYSHAGSNYGFKSEVCGFPQLGGGYAILANGDTNGLVDEIARAIRSAYGWT